MTSLQQLKSRFLCKNKTEKNIEYMDIKGSLHNMVVVSICQNLP